MYQRVLPVFERILYTRLTSRSSFRRRLRVLLPQRVELARFPSFFTYDQKVHPSTSRPVIALPAREGELKGCSWPSTRIVPSGFTAARYSFPLKVTRSSFGIRSPRARSAGCRFPGSRSFFAAGAASRIFLCLAATFSVRAWPALSALQRQQTVPFFFYALVVSSTCGRPPTSIGLPHVRGVLHRFAPPLKDDQLHAGFFSGSLSG